jgi:hypothetical protein
MPGGRETIQMHCDADYPKHYDTEINIWVPATDIRGSNGLYLESLPGRGDFHPLTMQLGQYLQFHGYSCRHYSMENVTDVTRVSFDFRVILLELYEEEFHGHIGDYTTAIAYPHGQAQTSGPLVVIN